MILRTLQLLALLVDASPQTADDETIERDPLLKKDQIEVEHALSLEFESGARGVIASSYVSPPTYTIRLSGTEAVLEYALDMSVWPQAHKADAASTLALRREDGSDEIDFPKRDPLAEELAEFGRAVRGEGSPETGAEEGIAALRVIEEAL